MTENVKPLIAAGLIREETTDGTGQSRKSRFLSLVNDEDDFVGLNLGVRRSQGGDDYAER